jgi:hypothetical protein
VIHSSSLGFPTQLHSGDKDEHRHRSIPSYLPRHSGAKLWVILARAMFGRSPQNPFTPGQSSPGPPTGVPWIFPPPFPADATTSAQAEGLCCSVPEGEPTGFGSPCMLSLKVSQPPKKRSYELTVCHRIVIGII